MDRRLKERLAGATILVVLIVLIVPELLSGPKRVISPRPSPTGAAEPVRNVTVDLATSEAMPGAATGTAGQGVGPAASTGAGPAADDAVPGESSSGVTPGSAALPSGESGSVHRGAAPPTITTLQAQQPASAAIENGASSPRSQSAPRAAATQPADLAHHNWAVQLGSFASRANAEKLERQLRGNGFSAFVAASGSGKTSRYRVRIGPMPDRGSADKVVAKLKRAGHAASVITP